MIAVAQSKSLIAYSDLVRKITSCVLEPNGAPLAHMLGEISLEEDEEGRGLLTVGVVHKTGDMKPGPGFFWLARSRGRQVVDEEEFWIEELHNVYNAWSRSGEARKDCTSRRRNTRWRHSPSTTKRPEAT